MKRLRHLFTRRARLVALLVGIPVLLAACMLPPGSYQVANPNVDVPDPAMITYTDIFGEFTQVYGSSSCGVAPPCAFLPNIHVPSYAETAPPSAQPQAVPVDALPSPQANTVFTWAPSVISAGGQYVMAFGDYFTSGQVCLGFAVSANAYTGFTAVPASTRCSPYGTSVNWLDPQFFRDSATGRLYLLFSQEIQPGCTGGGASGTGSSLWIVPMTSDGLSTNGGFTLLLTWAQATAIKGLNQGSLGGTACLENPNILNDPNQSGGNPYDLLFSIGTWKQPNSYFTGEVDCGQLDNTNVGCGVDPGGGAVFNQNGGGTSSWNTASPVGNYVMYTPLTFINGEPFRVDWVGGPTSYCDPIKNPNQCT